MQVIFKLQENPDLQEAVIALEASSLDTNKKRYRLCRTIVRALDVYWRDVRPNFMPNSGLSRKKICFHNAYGDLCFFYTHCFFVNCYGNEDFRVRQIPHTEMHRTKQLVHDDEQRKADLLERKVRMMLPTRHDSQSEIPSAALLSKVVTVALTNHQPRFSEVSIDKAVKTRYETLKGVKRTAQARLYVLQH